MNIERGLSHGLGVGVIVADGRTEIEGPDTKNEHLINKFHNLLQSCFPNPES